MHVTTLAPKQVGMGRAYALQYASLVLILITFTTGAFVGGHIPPLSSGDSGGELYEPLDRSEAHPLHEPQHISITHNALGEVEINEPLRVLITVLKSHDLEVQFRIPTSSDLLSRTLSKFLALERALLNEGVPRGAVRAIFPLDSSSSSSPVSYVLTPLSKVGE